MLEHPASLDYHLTPRTLHGWIVEKIHTSLNAHVQICIFCACAVYVPRVDLHQYMTRVVMAEGKTTSKLMDDGTVQEQSVTDVLGKLSDSQSELSRCCCASLCCRRTKS